jgi:2-methylcitrate dehydratase
MSADDTISKIADYARGLGFADLPDAAVRECKRRILDTLACGIAAFDDEPSTIVRTLALRAETPGGTRVLGTARRTLPELAAFANAVMARYLDGNDCFPGGGGHPSGAIAPIFAAAELTGADGRAVIAAMTAAYEIHHALHRSLRVMSHGLDHAFYVTVASAAGAGKTLGLSREQMINAIALAVTPNLPLAVTRRGNLSMWKGVAEGNGARNGMFAALMAQAGMTGPERAFEGKLGLAERTASIDLSGLGQSPLAITQADMKFFVTEYHSQGPLTAALKLAAGAAPDDIAAITIRTYEFAHKEIGSGPEKWRPKTRETADHSMPYIVAAVLVDGAFSDAIFKPERFTDPRILALADKITILEDAEFTRAFPAKFRCHVDIRLANGEARSADVDYPHGHHLDPMSDNEVMAKFRDLAGRKLPPARIEQAIELVWNLDRAPGIAPIFDALVIDA